MEHATHLKQLITYRKGQALGHQARDIVEGEQETQRSHVDCAEEQGNSRRVA